MDAYIAGGRAYDGAAAASDPNDSALKDAYSAQYLRQLQILITQRKENGQAVRDAQPSRARTEFVSASVTAPTASLVTCEVDDHVVYRVSDGSAVNDKVATSRWSVAMSFDGGLWKIDGRHETQTWDGEVMDACLGAPQS